MYEALPGSCRLYLCLATPTHQTELLLLCTTPDGRCHRNKGECDILRCLPKLREHYIQRHKTKQNCFIPPTPSPGHVEDDSAPRRNKTKQNKTHNLVTWGQQSTRTPFPAPSEEKGSALYPVNRMDSKEIWSQTNLASSPGPLPSCMRNLLSQSQTEPNL